jgi:phosphoadenosine phosphosulfate reductase
LRKVEPMQRALDELQARTWFSGLRRSQARSRSNTPVIELRHGRWKLHPIVDWTDRDVGRYLAQNDLPYHPLWDQGYVSIGDVHTTRPFSEGMDREDTRFFGLKRECGIHVEV